MTDRILLLGILVGAVVSADLIIPLSPVDVSFVIHGNKLGAGTRLTITHSCVSCRIHVTARVYAPDNTTIFAVDADKSTYNATNLDGTILTPPLTVDVGQGSSTRFILAFTTVQLNQTKLQLGHTSNLDGETLAYNIREVPNAESYQFTAYGNNVARLAVSAVSDAKVMPQMHLQDFTFSSNNVECHADLYAGGIPSKNGTPKYFLLTLRSQYQKKFVLSTVTVSAFTVILPIGCNIQLTFAKTPTTIARQLPPDSCGFAMSSEFPGNFVGEQMARSSSYEYAVTDNNYQAHFYVMSVDPGSGGSMTFLGDPKQNQTMVVTGNFTTQQWDPLSGGAKVNWNPAGPSRNGFLYIYLVYRHVETSTQSANSLSIGLVMIIQLLVRYLAS